MVIEIPGYTDRELVSVDKSNCIIVYNKFKIENENKNAKITQ